MIFSNGRQHSSNPSNPVQSHWRYWPHPSYSIFPPTLQLMRHTTNTNSKPQPKLPPTNRPSPSSNRKISSTWPSSLTTLRHRRPNPSLSPTTLWYHGCCRGVLTHSLPPSNRKQHTTSKPHTMSGSHHHHIYSHLRPHTKRHQKNRSLLHLKPTRPNNSYHRHQSTIFSIPAYLYSRLLQGPTFHMLRIHHS